MLRLEDHPEAVEAVAKNVFTDLQLTDLRSAGCDDFALLELAGLCRWWRDPSRVGRRYVEFPTAAERLAALKRVVNAAAELREALIGATILDSKSDHVGRPVEDRMLLIDVELDERLTAIQQRAQQHAATVDAARPKSRREGARKKSGRCSDFVHEIATVVERCGLKLSRQIESRFAKVCRICFDAADERAPVEGEIRFVLEQLKSNGGGKCATGGTH